MNGEKKPQQITFPCIKVSQPIGDFYIASIDSSSLYTMAFSDMRRIEDRDVEKYLGIQRPLDPKRTKELKQYVRTVDACFPTGVILAVEGICCKFDKDKSKMTLSEYIDLKHPGKSIPLGKVAKILDGQHRLEGLLGYDGPTFELNVSIFVDIDLSNQANIFSTVNLKQTKVNKSLAYDLYDLAKARSPQKTCHLIAVALDTQEKSPFHHRIKRLGVSEEGRFDDKLTQATFVQSLIRYISENRITEMMDRDIYLRGKKLEIVNDKESKKLVFRNMFIQEKDLDIASVIFNYFNAVKNRWPKAWESSGTGDILNRTNGFKALMRFLKPVYLYLTKPGGVPKSDEFLKIFKKIDLKDSDFTADNYIPGTSGESKLLSAFMEKSSIGIAEED